MININITSVTGEGYIMTKNEAHVSCTINKINYLHSLN